VVSSRFDPVSLAGPPPFDRFFATTHPKRPFREGFFPCPAVPALSFSLSDLIFGNSLDPAGLFAASCSWLCTTVLQALPPSFFLLTQCYFLSPSSCWFFLQPARQCPPSPAGTEATYVALFPCASRPLPRPIGPSFVKSLLPPLSVYHLPSSSTFFPALTAVLLGSLHVYPSSLLVSR